MKHFTYRIPSALGDLDDIFRRPYMENPLSLAQQAQQNRWESMIIRARPGGINLAYETARKQIEAQGQIVVTYSEWQTEIDPALPGMYRALVYFTTPRVAQNDQP